MVKRLSGNIAGGTGGGGTTSPGGSDTQVQFNDGGAFGGDGGLTYNKTTDELTVAGDINLDDGGTFSTTVQSVTPTANRTISFPDATGTVALVSGSNGTVQYNDAGTLKGNSDFTVDPDWNDASTVFTGLKLNVTDTASAAGSNLLDLQVGGTRKVSIDAVGLVELAGSTVSGGISFGNKQYGFQSAFDWTFKNPNGWIGFAAQGGSADIKLSRDAANILAQRNGTNAQTFRLYNTYTDASNFERTSITRDSSGLVIDAQKAGTGADPTNLLDLQLNGTSFASFNVSSGNSSLELPSGSTLFMDKSSSNGIVIGNYAGRNIRLGSATSIQFTDTAPTGTVDLQIKRDQANVLVVTDGSTGTGYVKQTPVAVSALPAAATVGAGTRGFVNDANATTFASVVAGGGANVVPVYSDGTDWRIG